jgi:hypothetical protein
MGNERNRLKLIGRLKQIFIDNPELEISKDKLILEICMMEGYTKKKSAEFIELLKEMEFIEENEGILWRKKC